MVWRVVVGVGARCALVGWRGNEWDGLRGWVFVGWW